MNECFLALNFRCCSSHCNDFVPSSTILRQIVHMYNRRVLVLKSSHNNHHRKTTVIVIGSTIIIYVIIIIVANYDVVSISRTLHT